MTREPAAKDGRGHTRDFMPDEWGSFQFTTSADAKRAEHMFNQLSSDRDRLMERVKELETSLDGLLAIMKRLNVEVTLADAPAIFAARELLSKSPK